MMIPMQINSYSNNLNITSVQNIINRTNSSNEMNESKQHFTMINYRKISRKRLSIIHLALRKKFHSHSIVNNRIAKCFRIDNNYNKNYCT